MTAETTASEEAAETQPAETETAAEDTETIDTTAAGETAGTTETTAAVTAEAAASQGTVGDTGMTESEWVAQAQQMYEKAAQTYYTYLCSSSGFTYDTEDTIADDYVRITSCDTLEDAEAPYYAVFAKSAHASDFDGMLEMSVRQNGRPRSRYFLRIVCGNGSHRQHLQPADLCSHFQL